MTGLFISTNHLLLPILEHKVRETVLMSERYCTLICPKSLSDFFNMQFQKKVNKIIF